MILYKEYRRHAIHVPANINNSSSNYDTQCKYPIRVIRPSLRPSICFSSRRARSSARGYNRRLKECLMSQTSHVGAIISTGTAYKAATASGETVAQRERARERERVEADSRKRIVIQRRKRKFSRGGPARRSRFECKAVRMAAAIKPPPKLTSSR